MSVLLQYVTQARLSLKDHTTRLAFRCMGIGYGWTTKFAKWIEAKPIKNLDAGTAVSFIGELIFRYGVPHSIITDNGSNFDSEEFRAFCTSQGTRVDYASVAHPQSNGQAERANGLILKGLKP